METFKLLDGSEWTRDALLEKMDDDSFYYGYLGKAAMSSSSLKHLLTSPRAYERSLRKKSDSAAFKEGRLVHLMALEPHRVEGLIDIVDVKTKATKAYKDKVAERGSEEFVFTSGEYKRCAYTAQALETNTMFQDIRSKSKFEVSGFGMVGGIPFRGKADILGEDENGRFICDLKTTADIKGFKWSARKYGYDVQVYLYSQIFDVPYTRFSFLAVEKGTGEIGYYTVSEDFYLSGRAKVAQALDTYKKYFLEKSEQIDNFILTGEL